ncbi:hypothetical protein ACO2KH_10475 [Leptospira terpstrae]|uniref:hypothetical protein n=1 Tax=Leptospira terpstrae TaxID=293075 RepID=UPI003CFF29C5
MVILRTFILFSIFLLFSHCTKTSQPYESCERADLDNLACSLVVYQSYTFCAETAVNVSGSIESKAAAKFRCDAERLVGSYLCDDIKKKACGTK